jgi:radical SAM superfamily enzyme
MSECKHGLRHGCTYCHTPTTTGTTSPPARKRGTRASRLSEQMNDRMTQLKKRLRELRGE